jgi:TPR repeat protein
MSSIDDMPEHYREDFDGYEPDSLHVQTIEGMPYFQNMIRSTYPRRYGKKALPSSEEIEDFEKLIKKEKNASKDLSLHDKFTLAWHYEHGIKPNLSNIFNGQRSPDYKSAINLYDEIYNKGRGSKKLDNDIFDDNLFLSMDAAHQIGILHEKGGYGLSQDYSISAKWYLKSLELKKKLGIQKKIHIDSHGDRSSEITLARLYIEGLGVEENHSKALNILSELNIMGRRFPSFMHKIEHNDALKYFLFSRIYSFDSIDGGYFKSSYGFTLNKDSFEEECYFISKNTQKELWKKWIKKAVDLDHIEAIVEYAYGLDQSHFLEYLDPENKEEFYSAYKDTINSLYYFKKLSQMRDNYHSDTYSENLAMTQHSIYKFAIKAQKYDELSKDKK